MDIWWKLLRTMFSFYSSSHPSHLSQNLHLQIVTWCCNLPPILLHPSLCWSHSATFDQITLRLLLSPITLTPQRAHACFYFLFIRRVHQMRDVTLDSKHSEELQKARKLLKGSNERTFIQASIYWSNWT